MITKPPSAELRPDQKDEDSLPPYDELDAILHGLIEEDLGADDLIGRGYDAATVQRIWRATAAIRSPTRSGARLSVEIAVQPSPGGRGWRAKASRVRGQGLSSC
jgi:NH3-dependent NAD+ synthetase